MSTRKRLRTSLIVMFGVIIAVMTFAGPANAAVYPPPPGTQVIAATTGSAEAVAAATTSYDPGAVATTNSGLAFTGTNAISIGVLGGLLLVGGGVLVLVARGRKADS